MGESIFPMLLGQVASSVLGSGGRQQESNPAPFPTPAPAAPVANPMSQGSPFYGQNAPFGGRTNAINAMKNVS